MSMHQSLSESRSSDHLTHAVVYKPPRVSGRLSACLIQLSKYVTHLLGAFCVH